jgi:hypothetical protein
MNGIQRKTVVNSVKGLIETLRFPDARALIQFYREIFSDNSDIARDLSRLEIDIELNDGDVDKAVSALYSKVFDEYSTESARILLEHCWRTQRTDESERICAFVQEKLAEAANAMDRSSERLRIEVGRRYFVARQLQFAVINGTNPELIKKLQAEVESFPGGKMGSWGFISSIQDGSTVDPAAVTREKWHTSREINFFPLHFPPSMPFAAAIDDLVLNGQDARKIVVAKSDVILTYGSCFAANLRNSLSNRGFSAESIDIPAGLNNTVALLNYFRWALTGGSIGDGAYDRTRSGAIEKWSDREGHHVHLEALKRTKLLVITLGLSEVWYDRESGDVFWRGVPEKDYSESRHAFRVLTVEETKENIREMLSLLRLHLADTPIFLTVSPIPLQATFTGQNCVVADTQSKTVIRAAVGETLGEIEDENVIYWPAFEMIRWLGSHLSYATLHDGDSRHPDKGLVDDIISAFCRIHLSPSE